MVHEQYPLVVDSREQSNVTAILDSYGIKYTRAMLPTGDFEITTPEGEVTLERKTMTDFIGSLMTGRLEEQMRRLALKPCPMLLLTGSFEDYRRYAKTTKFTADQVVGAVASCIVKYGLRGVFWVQKEHNDPHSTGISLACKIIRKVSEGKLDQIPDRKLKDTKIYPQRELIGLICGVPSPVSEALLTHFGCVRAILDAKDEDLLKVKGMGETRIKKMRKLLGDIK